MKNSIQLLLLLWIFAACKSGNNIAKENELKEWIQAHKDSLNKDINAYIKEYDNQMSKFYPDPMPGKVVFPIDAPFYLGELAKKAGDSTDCIAVILSFAENRIQKKKITIAAIDSSCFNKLKNIYLPIDSTSDFIFGNELEVLQK